MNEFKCQNCDKLNCILCKAQHDGMNCQEYQDDLKIKAANDEAAKETQAMLEVKIDTISIPLNTYYLFLFPLLSLTC